MSTVTFDTSILTSYFAAKAGLANTASASATSTAAKAPTAPWTQPTEAATVSALTSSVIAGASFINPSAAKLDAPATAASSSDYRNLFALYQGLSALNGIAAQASAKTTSASQAAVLQQRFAAGLTEVQSFLAGKPFSAMTFADAGVSATVSGTVGAPRESDSYATGPLVSGGATQLVPGLDPDAAFSLTAHKLSGDVTVDFDLSDMGATPRTLSNVVSYLNGKLSAAGLATRFAVKTTPGVAQTTTAGGQTVSLGTTSPTTYGLTITGSSLEPLSFAAPDASPAVYVAQSSGSTEGTAPDATQQLYKLNPGASGDGADPVFDRTLPAGLGTVRATATGPDGSVYLLADITGPTPDGQALQGAQDVALVKYDSAGQIAYTRTLGAAQSASGYALAVSPDGAQVAIAGTVTGDLDPGDAPSAGASSSFVQVFNSDGEALWDQRSVTTGEQPKAIAFAADGTLLVSGATHTDLQTPGAQGGYVRSYAAAPQTAFDGSSLGYRVTTASAASVAAPAAGVLALPGGGVAMATVQNGHAILSLYASPFAAGAQPTATRDLGDLGGGGVAGLALGADGSIVVAGTSGSGALQAGSVTTGYASGLEAFVARVSPDLQPSAGDRTTYLALGGATTATGIAVADGEVYLTGQVAGAPAEGQTGPSHSGYALALDPGTGEVNWSQSLGGADGQAAPAGIAVASRGVSTLDALGLPSGAIDYTPSQLITADTAARPGDSFTLRVGSGAPVKVTLAADDTLQTLATKINRAAGFAATATTTTAGSATQLKIAPASSSASLTLQAGPAGGDLLAALGLPEGLVQTPTTTKNTKTSVPSTPYALGLSSSMSVASVAAATAATTNLQAAMATVQKAYTDLITPPASASATTSSSSVSAYTQSRLANYQLALQRLTGSG